MERTSLLPMGFPAATPAAADLECTAGEQVLAVGSASSGAPHHGGRRSAIAGLLLGASLLVVGAALRGAAAGGKVRRSSAELSELAGLAQVRAAAPQPKCTVGGENCNVTQCCADPGLQCYMQDGLYSQCRAACNPGPDPTHWDEKSWSCQTLGNRSAGSAKRCSNPGEDCSHTQCCSQPGAQCFRKSDGWAACKAECTPGAPDMADQDNTPWSCERLGPFTPGAQGWVWQKCSKAGEACTQTKCCLEGGAQCYSQTGPVEAPYWAQCKQSCTPGEKANPWEQGWDCKEVGSRTPAPLARGGGVLAKWAQQQCSPYGESCLKSKCCLGMDAVCYEKNSKYATCKTSCTPGPDPYDNNATWTCKELGGRSTGMAIKGWPSLYCFALTRTTGYEVAIMQAQINNSIGIFGCDQADIFSPDGMVTLGRLLGGHDVKTIPVEPATIKITVDGTAGNAKLFANMWDKVVEEGRWRNHAWTVKVDPDAVLIPSRLRSHMYQHVGEKVYVLNCNKFPSSPNFPMMFGSIEIFSFQAMDAFATGKEQCKASMGQWLESWGEDYYLGKCMDSIGVGRIADFGVVGDSVCTGVDCNNPGIAAFHAFKSEADWMNCHSMASVQEYRK